MERETIAAEIRQEAEHRFNPVGIRDRLLARRGTFPAGVRERDIYFKSFQRQGKRVGFNPLKLLAVGLNPRRAMRLIEYLCPRT
ncbi:MAG: hypothetical protein AB4352_14040 [Hormoscilla sp.]